LDAGDDTGSSNTDNITQETSVLTITGWGESDAGVELFADADSDGVIDAGESLGSAIMSNGLFSSDISLTPGIHELKAIQTDVAGNVSVGSAALIITVDTTSPEVLNHVATLNEGATLVLADSHLSATDTYCAPTVLILAVDNLPSHGQLKKDGSGLAFDATFTQADVTASKITYTHDHSETASDVFTFTVKDLAGNETAVTAFTFTIAPVNEAPVLDPIGNKSVNDQTPLTFTATATDQDQPAQALTFSLDQASLNAGMTIDPATGAFLWTPVADQGPGGYDVTITVADDETPALSDSETFTIVIVGPTWRNPRHRCDVNDDGEITPADVLALINDINARSSRDLTTASPPTPAPPPFLDPSGDDEISPADVLMVINYVNRYGAGPIPRKSGGEGEHVPMLGVYPSLPLPDTDAAESALPVDTVSDRERGTGWAVSTRRLAFCLPGQRPAMATAAIQECLKRRSQDETFPASWLSPPSARTADGSLKFTAEMLDLEAAIAVIAAEVGRGWSLSR